MALQNPFEELAERLKRIENHLTAMNHQSQEQGKQEDDLPITISEASKLTKLAVPTIYGLVHQRKIPSYRRGKRLYFLKSELLNWIKSGRQSTIQEIKKDAQNSLLQDR